MLTADGCKNRRQRLWNATAPKPDWILISDPQSQMYLANYYQSPFVFRSTNAAAIVILGADGSSILVADNLVEGFAHAAAVDDVVTPIWYRGKESAPHREALLVQSVLERMKKCPGKRLGVESATLPAGILAGLEASRGRLEIVNVDPILHQLKRQKDADELALMRRSMEAGEAGFSAALAGVKPGMTELDAYLLVSRAVNAAADEQVGVYGDFVSGPRCEQVGGPPTQRVIAKGDLFLLDFSVVVYGYRGDFANTFVVAGRPDDQKRRLFDACFAAMTAGERHLKAGADCRAIDRAVRDVFDAEHLGQNFSSHSGHGLGLGHPDPPYIVPESGDRLLAGDIVTLEPGQYIAGVAGMRFERNYLITDQGFELLSDHFIGLDAPA